MQRVKTVHHGVKARNSHVVEELVAAKGVRSVGGNVSITDEQLAGAPRAARATGRRFDPRADAAARIDCPPALCSNREMAALELLGGVTSVIAALDVDPAKGLRSDEVEARRTRFGPNTFPEQPPRSFLSFVWDAMQDMTLAVLAAAALLSLVALIKEPNDGWHDCVAILIAISVCVFVAAYNDYSQSLQFRALNADKRNIQINVVRVS